MNDENGLWTSDNRVLQLDAMVAHTLENNGYFRLDIPGSIEKAPQSEGLA